MDDVVVLAMVVDIIVVVVPLAILWVGTDPHAARGSIIAVATAPHLAITVKYGGRTSIPLEEGTCVCANEENVLAKKGRV